jgi:hypothetical protein
MTPPTNCQTGTEARRALIRAYLAGYWQAVEDFGVYSARRRRSPLEVGGVLRRRGRTANSTRATPPPPT